MSGALKVHCLGFSGSDVAEHPLFHPLPRGAQKTQKAFFRDNVLFVCSVKTWRWNMADSMEVDPLPP